MSKSKKRLKELREAYVYVIARLKALTANAELDHLHNDSPHHYGVDYEDLESRLKSVLRDIEGHKLVVTRMMQEEDNEGEE